MDALDKPLCWTTLFETEECRAFGRAWSRWRSGALVPSRDDVRLEEIKPVLPMLGGRTDGASRQLFAVMRPRQRKPRLSRERGRELTGLVDECRFIAIGAGPPGVDAEGRRSVFLPSWLHTHPDNYYHTIAT